MDYVYRYRSPLRNLSSELNRNRPHCTSATRVLFVCNIQLRELMIPMSLAREEKKSFKQERKNERTNGWTNGRTGERNTNEFSRAHSLRAQLENLFWRMVDDRGGSRLSVEQEMKEGETWRRKKLWKRLYTRDDNRLLFRRAIRTSPDQRERLL